jgi:hypothetical protein
MSEAVREMAEQPPEWGPAMSALRSERQRRFVCALFEFYGAKGRVSYAARAAGYSASSGRVIRAAGGRLMMDRKIQAAIAEESQRRLRGLAPAAIVAIEKLVADPAHRDHGRALAMIVDRASPIASTHDINVNVNTAPPMNMERVLARIETLCARVGVMPAPKVIEGKATEIEAPA